MNTTVTTQSKALVSAAIASGLIKPAAPTAPMRSAAKPRDKAKHLAYNTAYNRLWRARRAAAGLNVRTGKPLVKTKRPELAGLDRKTYRREIARIYRANTPHMKAFRNALQNAGMPPRNDFDSRNA